MLASFLLRRCAYINSFFSSLSSPYEIYAGFAPSFTMAMMKSLRNDHRWTLLLADLQHFTFDVVAITAFIIPRVTTSDRMSYEAPYL